MRGASFGPMAAISRHGQGGRIYNNTRARVLLRRMCVKPANRTTHSPPKAFARPRTAHALPEHFFTPSSRRRTPADLITHSPPKTFARPRSPDARPQAARCIPRRPHHPFPPKTFAHPRTATRPSRALPIAHATPTHARRLRDAFPTDLTTHSPAEALRSSPHSDTPSPSTSAPPRNPDTRPRSPDARPQAAQRIPRSPHNSLPAAPRCLPFRSASGTKKRHRTVHVRCRMFRSTVVAVGHLGW